MGCNCSHLFGVDGSTSANWAYVWGIKGRWDERKKIEEGIELNKETLNEEARGHYHDEIVDAVMKLCGYLPEGAAPLYVPHENFNRDIGAFSKGRYTVEGTEFQGDDAQWDAYLAEHLPTAEDEKFEGTFKQEWIAEKPMSQKQIASESALPLEVVNDSGGDLWSRHRSM